MKILDKYHILIIYGKHNLVCNMFGKFETEIQNLSLWSPEDLGSTELKTKWRKCVHTVKIIECFYHLLWHSNLKLFASTLWIKCIYRYKIENMF